MMDSEDATTERVKLFGGSVTTVGGRVEALLLLAILVELRETNRLLFEVYQMKAREIW